MPVLPCNETVSAVTRPLPVMLPPVRFAVAAVVVPLSVSVAPELSVAFVLALTEPAFVTLPVPVSVTLLAVLFTVMNVTGPPVWLKVMDPPFVRLVTATDEDVLLRWYVDRFLMLRETSFRDHMSYFHRYSNLSDEEAVETATSIWTRINLLNLHENIQPTRQRADLILKKAANHAVEQVSLRRL